MGASRRVAGRRTATGAAGGAPCASPCATVRATPSWCRARSRSAERFRILRPVTATLLQLGPVAGEQSAQAIVAGVGLSDGGVDGRPRVAAAMIASADGRATVAGTSVGLGHPADRALLRELRTAVDAILVGTGTLRAEGYAHLLDDDQRERRAAAGL